MQNEEKAIFNINYQGIVFRCEVSMAIGSYAVFLDGDPAGSIQMNGNGAWEQKSGKPLPQDLIDLIGGKIEQHYE